MNLEVDLAAYKSINKLNYPKNRDIQKEKEEREKQFEEQYKLYEEELKRQEENNRFVRPSNIIKLNIPTKRREVLRLPSTPTSGY